MSNSFRFKGVNGKTTALFEIMSRANHSCDPNVRMIGDGWPGQLIAVRPIQAQEEILLCYGGWDTEFLKEPSTARQKYLSEHWGFQCKCVRCEREASIRTS
ncbi:SET domain and MYND-type zinc finger protein 6 [Durusdinium trenchii]